LEGKEQPAEKREVFVEGLQACPRFSGSDRLPRSLLDHRMHEESCVAPSTPARSMSSATAMFTISVIPYKTLGIFDLHQMYC
jgi:hypothetical protein